MADWEFNPLCKCKQCTGEGLGWIKHITKHQSNARFLREARERKKQIEWEEKLGPR